MFDLKQVEELAAAVARVPDLPSFLTTPVRLDPDFAASLDALSRAWRSKAVQKHMPPKEKK